VGKAAGGHEEWPESGHFAHFLTPPRHHRRARERANGRAGGSARHPGGGFACEAAAGKTSRGAAPLRVAAQPSPVWTEWVLGRFQYLDKRGGSPGPRGDMDVGARALSRHTNNGRRHGKRAADAVPASCQLIDSKAVMARQSTLCQSGPIPAQMLSRGRWHVDRASALAPRPRRQRSAR